MKIAITGHTRGIGQAIAQRFRQDGHEVLGWSKSQGYDIANPNHRRKILDQSRGFDILINNAWDIRGQLEMLNDWSRSADHANTVIMHVSSTITEQTVMPGAQPTLEYLGKTVPVDDNLDWYMHSKLKSRKQVSLLRKQHQDRIISVLTIGLTDTDLTRGYGRLEQFSDRTLITVESIAEEIYSYTVNQGWLQNLELRIENT